MTTALADQLCAARRSHRDHGAEELAPRYVDRDEWRDIAARVRVLDEALEVAATMASEVDAATRLAIVEAAERLVDRLRVVLL